MPELAEQVRCRYNSNKRLNLAEVRMSPEQVKILVVFVLVVVAGLVAGYYLVRYLKGSIKISLARTTFGPGERVEGAFELLARKEIQGRRLFAALVGTETTERRGSNGKTTHHSHEIFRTEQELEAAKSYPAGYTAKYNFQLALPSAPGADASASVLGQVLQAGIQILGSGRRRISWKVEARLDADGVDLASSETIRVNMPGLF